MSGRARRADPRSRKRNSPYGLSLGNLACRNLAEISEEERVLALRHAAQTSYPESAGVIRPRAPCVFRASPSALARCCVSTQGARLRPSDRRLPNRLPQECRGRAAAPRLPESRSCGVFRWRAHLLARRSAAETADRGVAR